MYIKAFFIVLISLVMTDLSAQNDSPMPTTEAEAMAKYERNIKKSRINGVYIPKDEKEAVQELKELSPPKSLAKFKSQPEDVVIQKLHFGLGRWMRYNWSFYDGSRLSEHLKTLGISYPDDMSTFLMRLLYRDLNGLPANEKEIIADIRKTRKQKPMDLVK